MRELQFRAWDKSQKYMAYQGHPDLETLSSFMFHFGEDIVMQAIGIQDKDTNEVYEGDILKDTEFDEEGNDINQSDKVNDIDPVQKDLLLVQAGAMYAYNECLKARIARL